MACARLRARSSNPYEHTLELDRKWKSQRVQARHRANKDPKQLTHASARREDATSVASNCT
eukprot:6519078-Prorocentrum_lima.AAC.1